MLCIGELTCADVRLFVCGLSERRESVCLCLEQCVFVRLTAAGIRFAVPLPTVPVCYYLAPSAICVRLCGLCLPVALQCVTEFKPQSALQVPRLSCTHTRFHVTTVRSDVCVVLVFVIKANPCFADNTHACSVPA